MFERSNESVVSDSTTGALSQFSVRPYRHKLRTLAYADLGAAGKGILRDLGQSGVAVQTATPLLIGEQIELRLDLPSPRCHVDAVGRVVWTDSTAQAGVQFVAVSARSQQVLNQWILTQLLTDATRVAGEGELLFSSASRPAIHLDEPCILPSFLPVSSEDSPRLRLLGFGVSAPRFARVVDGLVLLCSVLLFSLISLFLIDVLPPWWFAIAFLLGATTLFAGLYWCVFAMWFGTTPGNRLAELAGSSSEGASFHQAQRDRFR